MASSYASAFKYSFASPKRTSVFSGSDSNICLNVSMRDAAILFPGFSLELKLDSKNFPARIFCECENAEGSRQLRWLLDSRSRKQNMVHYTQGDATTIPVFPYP